MRAIRQLALGVALSVAGCGGATDATSSEEPSSASNGPSVGVPTNTKSTTQPPPAGPPRGKILKTSDSAFGTILYDGTGQAIYVFDKEVDRPECYRACAAAWPPVLTHGSPQATLEIHADLLGTTRRADGSTQVTYAGQPLYYYVHDGKNEVLCHNVTEFGGLWQVITPDGNAAA